MLFLNINPDLILENHPPIQPITQLDEIDEMANSVDDTLAKELHVPKDVLDSFKLKDSLNPEIWPDGVLDPKLQQKLMKIANGFIKDLNLPKGIKIKDIIFTGSLANYNWSKFSDVDLHVVINFNQFDGDLQMIQDYFKVQKNLWNDEHTITILSYPVETYVQDSNQKLVATAVYSILHNKWVKKPKRETFKLDKLAIKDKADKFINQLKNIRDDYKDKQYQTVVDKTTKLKNKVKQMRKAGLEKGGEFSIENLVFKVLRRIPFMDILGSYKAKAYDATMSMMETLTETETDKTGGVLFILGAPLSDGSQRLYVTTIKTVMQLDRKKVSNELGQSAEMAVFGNNEVFRVGPNDGRLKPFRVAWGDNNTKLQKLGLKKTSVTINNNKTPIHWLSTKYNNIPQAVNALSGTLHNLSNIKWVG